MTLYEAREIADLSLASLAGLSGVSIKTIDRMERGMPVQRNSFVLVCQALKVDPQTIEGVKFAGGFKGRRK